MKKTVPVVVSLTIGIALSVIFLPTGSRRAVHASDLAPAETLVFLHLPDLGRSAKRLPETALAKIGREPEMQAFLERPLSKLPDNKEAHDTIARFERIQAGEVFVAVTEVNDSAAKFVGGFSFTGSRAEVDALRPDLKGMLPTGKVERVNYAGAEIDTLTDAKTFVADTVHAGWWLAANDLDALKSAIDRLNGKPEAAGKSLARSEQFRSTIAVGTRDPDLMMYGDVDTLLHRVLPMVASAGLPIPAETMASLKQAKAIAYSIRMDGTQFRESAFLLSPGGKAGAALPLRSLAHSTAATSMLYAGALPASTGMSESTRAMLALVPGYSDLEKALSGSGMKPEDIGNVFGPEFGMFLDWPEKEPAPSIAFTIDVRDAAKAKAAAAALAGGSAGWEKSEHGGAIVLSQKSDALLGLIQPTIALGEKLAVLGLSPAGVNAVLDRATAPQNQISAAASFQTAATQVAAPTSGFAFIDLKTLFERSYGTVRPLAVLALAFQPEVGRYIDAGKLPKTATIAQHLGPVVYSNSTTESGTLIESSGPITMTQLGLLLGGSGAGAAASGMLESGGALDPKALGLPTPRAGGESGEGARDR